MSDLVATAEREGPQLSSRPPLACREVLGARSALSELAGALRAAEEVSARGILLVQRLLIYRRGPLYVDH